MRKMWEENPTCIPLYNRYGRAGQPAAYFLRDAWFPVVPT